MNRTKNPTNPGFIHTVDHGVEIAFWIANALGQGVGSIIERGGEILSRLLDTLGNNMHGILGKILRGMFHWLGAIISAGFDLVATLICSMANLLANVLGGTVRILAGLLGTDRQIIRNGAMDILFGVIGVVIAIVNKLVAMIQTVIFMQMGERSLSEYEKRVVRQVYRDSVTSQNIRIVTGFVGLFSANNDRPFTLGNRIYFKYIEPANDPGLFAHECCHVWQYQRYGVRYIAEALWAQFKVPNAYSWEGEIGRGKTRWQEFNREAQAQFVQDIYNGGRRKPSTRTAGEMFDDNPVGEAVEYIRRNVDYTDLAKQAITFIRSKGHS